jgi:hypothetical protein
MITALMAGFLIASCAPSTPQARIQQNPQLFESLSAEHRSLVENGRISRGMSPDAVQLAWGAPSRTFQGSSAGKDFERWDYSGSRPVHVTSFHGGFGNDWRYGRRGYSSLGWGIGPDIAYVPYHIASVWFSNQRVDSWERAR